MLITLSGIVTSVKLVQLLNASSPILVTLFGIVTSVKLVQSSNAEESILVTLLGITYSLSVLPAGYVINSDLSLLNKIPSNEE